ncbi:MAG: tetratricopeptide repeat protein [Planctomycetes bacterium]|nr:tetratricopeptide repeat protein [Planctomycetota bacterium]
MQNNAKYTCADCALSMPDALTGRISAEDAPAFEAHLSGCAACRGLLDAMSPAARLLHRAYPRDDAASIKLWKNIEARSQRGENLSAAARGKRPTQGPIFAAAGLAAAAALVVLAATLGLAPARAPEPVAARAETRKPQAPPPPEQAIAAAKASPDVSIPKPEAVGEDSSPKGAATEARPLSGAVAGPDKPGQDAFPYEHPELAVPQPEVPAVAAQLPAPPPKHADRGPREAYDDEGGWALLRRTGPVAVFDPALNDWRSIVPGERVPYGARVRTAPGALAELAFGESRVRLDERTEMLVTRGEERVRIAELAQGRLRVDLLRSDAGFHVRSGGGEVALTGTVVEVESPAPELALARVLEGHVEIAAHAGERTIHLKAKAGEEALLAEGAAENAYASLPEPLRARARALAAEAGRILPMAANARPWDEALDKPPGRAEAAVGQLVVKDEQGREAGPLAVAKMDVHAVIRGAEALTRVEQTFRNTTPRTLEGTFYFPLPPGAAISRFAMYVDENQTKLIEGEVVERQQARAIFESILRQRRDPALLEWMEGNLFKARIFPIPPHGLKRIILEYTQLLPAFHDTRRYVFPLVNELTAQHPIEELAIRVDLAAAEGGKLARAYSPSYARQTRIEGLDTANARAELSLRAARPAADFVFTFAAPRTSELETAAYGEKGEAPYVLLGFQPALENAGQAAPRKDAGRDVLILLETSGARSQQDLDAQARVAAALLAGLDRSKDRAALAAVDVSLEALTDGFQPAFGAALPRAFEKLSRRAPLGALDLGAVLREAAGYFPQGAPAGRERTVIFIGSGIPALGALEDAELARDGAAELFKAHARFIGVGLGRAVDAAVMSELARKTGGFYWPLKAEEGLDEAAFLLGLSLQTPLLEAPVFTADEGAFDQIYPRQMPSLLPGHEVFLHARMAAKPAGAPVKLAFSGMFQGKPLTRSYAMKLPDDLAVDPAVGRFWARAMLDDLLTATQTAEVRKAIVDLAQAWTLMSPYTSFLVLESNEDYTRYGIDRSKRRRLWRDEAASAPPEARPAPENAGPQQPFSLKVTDKPLKQVLDFLSQVGRVEIRLNRANDEALPVSMDLQNATWERTLDFLERKYDLVIDRAALQQKVIAVATRPKVSLRFENTEVREVVRSIAQQAGVELAVNPEVAGAVSLRIENAAWKDALAQIAGMLDCKLVLDGGPKAHLMSDRPADRIHTRIFRLAYLTPEAVPAVRALTAAEREKPAEAGGEILLDLLLQMKGPAGQLTFVKHGGALIASDTNSKLDAMEEAVKALDTKETAAFLGKTGHEDFASAVRHVLASAQPADGYAKLRELVAAHAAREQTPEPEHPKEAPETDAEIHLTAGRRLFEVFEYEQARAEFEKAVALERGNDEARKWLQRVNDVLGRRRDRIASAANGLYGELKIAVQERLAELDNRLDWAKKFAAQAQSDPELSPVERIRKLEQSAQALERAHEIIKWMPPNVNVEEEQNRTLRMLRETRAAKKKKEEDLAQTDRKTAQDLAEARAGQDREFREKTLGVLLDQSKAFFESGQYEKAAEAARKILEQDPTNAEANTLQAAAESRIHLTRRNWSKDGNDAPGAAANASSQSSLFPSGGGPGPADEPRATTTLSAPYLDRMMSAQGELPAEERAKLQEAAVALAVSLEEGKRLENKGDEVPFVLEDEAKAKALAEQLEALRAAQDRYRRVKEIMNFLPPQIDLPGERKNIEESLVRIRQKLLDKDDEVTFIRRLQAQKVAEQTRVKETELFKQRMDGLNRQTAELYSLGQYKEAERLSLRTLQLDPFNTEAEVLKRKARDAYQTGGEQVGKNNYKVLYGLLTPRSLSEELNGSSNPPHWKAALDNGKSRSVTPGSWIEEEAAEQKEAEELRADRMTIPHGKYLLYPESWQEIAQRRELTHAGSGNAEEPWKLEARKKLSRHVSFEFVDTPLDEALNFLDSLSKVGVSVDPRIAAEGAYKTPITLRVADMDMETALKWMLRLSDLDYEIKDHGIFITKKANLADSVRLEIYDVRDLTTNVPDFPGPKFPELSPDALKGDYGDIRNLGGVAGQTTPPRMELGTANNTAPLEQLGVQFSGFGFDIQKGNKHKGLQSEFDDLKQEVEELRRKLRDAVPNRDSKPIARVEANVENKYGPNAQTGNDVPFPGIIDGPNPDRSNLSATSGFNYYLRGNDAKIWFNLHGVDTDRGRSNENELTRQLFGPPLQPYLGNSATLVRSFFVSTGYRLTGKTSADLADEIRKRLASEFGDATTSIEESGGKLVVMQRPGVQEQIQRILKDLRREAQGASPFEGQRDGSAGRIPVVTNSGGLVWTAPIGFDLDPASAGSEARTITNRLYIDPNTGWEAIEDKMRYTPLSAVGADDENGETQRERASKIDFVAELRRDRMDGQWNNGIPFSTERERNFPFDVGKGLIRGMLGNWTGAQETFALPSPGDGAKEHANDFAAQLDALRKEPARPFAPLGEHDLDEDHTEARAERALADKDEQLANLRKEMQAHETEDARLALEIESARKLNDALAKENLEALKERLLTAQTRPQEERASLSQDEQRIREMENDLLATKQTLAALERDRKEIAEDLATQTKRIKTMLDKNVPVWEYLQVDPQAGPLPERHELAPPSPEKPQQTSAQTSPVRTVRSVELELNGAKQKLATLARDKRAIEDDLAIQTRRVETLLAKGVPVWDYIQDDPEAEQPYIPDALVLGVKPELNLVMISVGNLQGVKPGYRFTVSRGDQYIAKAQIERVYPDMSSARLLLKKGEVKVHDEVKSRVSSGKQGEGQAAGNPKGEEGGKGSVQMSLEQILQALESTPKSKENAKLRCDLFLQAARLSKDMPACLALAAGLAEFNWEGEYAEVLARNLAERIKQLDSPRDLEGLLERVKDAGMRGLILARRAEMEPQAATACRLWELAYRESGEDPAYLRPLAASLGATGKAARAIELLEGQLRQGGADPWICQALGTLYRQTGDTKSALRVLTQEVALRPREAEPRRALAQAFENLGRHAEALRELRAACEFAPENAAAHRELAALALKQHDLDAQEWAGLRMLDGVWRSEDGKVWEEAERALKDLEEDFRKSGDEPRALALKKKIEAAHATDIVAVLSWDTDKTDIDLHVEEPGQNHVSYQSKTSFRGGVLDRDVTTGYGPETYTLKRAAPGKYRIWVDYYAGTPQTEVKVKITCHKGGKDEETRAFKVKLKNVKDQAEILSFDWPLQNAGK